MKQAAAWKQEWTCEPVNWTDERRAALEAHVREQLKAHAPAGKKGQRLLERLSEEPKLTTALLSDLTCMTNTTLAWAIGVSKIQSDDGKTRYGVTTSNAIRRIIERVNPDDMTGENAGDVASASSSDGMPPTVPSANPGVGKRAAEGDGKDDDAKRVKNLDGAANRFEPPISLGTMVAAKQHGEGWILGRLRMFDSSSDTVRAPTPIRPLNAQPCQHALLTGWALVCQYYIEDEDTATSKEPTVFSVPMSQVLPVSMLALSAARCI